MIEIQLSQMSMTKLITWLDYKHVQVPQIINYRNQAFSILQPIGDWKVVSLYHQYMSKGICTSKIHNILIIVKKIMKIYALFLISISLHVEFLLWSYLNRRYAKLLN